MNLTKTMVCGFTLVLFLLISGRVYAFDWIDWLAHWNITMSAPTENPVLTSPKHEASFALRDDFGDYYYFHLQQAPVNSELELKPLYMIRVPLYYTQDLSVGVQAGSKMFSEEVTPGGNVFGDVSGIYIGKDFGPIGLIGFVGESRYYHSGDAGEVKRAWSGDPGMYINGRWIDPGEEMSFGASTDRALAWALSMHYKLLPAVYVEVAYEHWGGGTTSGYEYEVDGMKVIVDELKLPRPVTFSDHGFWRLGIGVGF